MVVGDDQQPLGGHPNVWIRAESGLACELPPIYQVERMIFVDAPDDQLVQLARDHRWSGSVFHAMPHTPEEYVRLHP